MSDDPKELPEPNALESVDDDSDSSDDEGYDEQAPKFARTVDYLETEKGHEITLRLVTILEQLSPTLKTFLEAKIESHRTLPTLEFRKWALVLVVRLVVFVVAVGALIYMRKVGSIDPAIALLIGGLVAYFFGYNKSQS